MPSKYSLNYRRALLLAIFLFSLLNVAHAQEIPNGDGDLLWEKSIYPRFVNDAKFHPINGNIIAAVNHEIWEIDPSDGHTIRVMYYGTSSEEQHHFHSIDITSDGSTILTDDGDSLLVWDYAKGELKQSFHNGETIAWQGLGGIFPDDIRVVYFSYNTEQQVRKLNIYDISTNSIIKSISTYPKSADQVKLSKDGRYLAIGFRYRPVSDMIYTMELWDAETLTKIRDFGEATNTNEFKDIQISNNNKYVGFLGNIGFDLKLYTIEGNTINLSPFYQVNRFGFSNDGNKTILDGFINSVYQTIVINNPLDSPLYSFTKMLNVIRCSPNEEIFTAGISMRFFSNNWYTVGIKPNLESKESIYPNPATEYIALNVPPLEKRGLGGVLQQIRIFDIFGDEMHPPRPSGTPQEGNKYRIDVSTLQAGVYFVRIGNEKPMKFVVVR